MTPDTKRVTIHWYKQFFWYGLLYTLPCFFLACGVIGISRGKEWSGTGMLFLAASFFGHRVREQQGLERYVRAVPSILDWSAVGNYLRRALRQEAMALGGTDLVGKVTSKDDMGVLPPPEMFLTLKEIDKDAVRQVLEQAQVLQEQEHREEARRVAMRSWWRAP